MIMLWVYRPKSMSLIKKLDIKVKGIKVITIARLTCVIDQGIEIRVEAAMVIEGREIVVRMIKEVLMSLPIVLKLR